MKEKIKKIVQGLTLEKVIKLSIVLAILLVSFAVFYHYVIFLPQKEEARLKQEKQEQLAKEIKEQEAKAEAERALNVCLADAEESYSNQWYRECKSRSKLTSRCISLHEMTFEEYQKEKGLEGFEGFTDYYKELDECSCLLPTTVAKDIGDYRDGLKADCFKKYPVR